MREEDADAQRTDPCGLDVREAKGAFENQQDRKRSEDEKDIERDAIAPSCPLNHHEDGQEHDGALREPLEERL